MQLSVTERPLCGASPPAELVFERGYASIYLKKQRSPFWEFSQDDTGFTVNGGEAAAPTPEHPAPPVYLCSGLLKYQPLSSRVRRILSYLSLGTLSRYYHRHHLFGVPLPLCVLLGTLPESQGLLYTPLSLHMHRLRYSQASLFFSPLTVLPVLSLQHLMSVVTEGYPALFMIRERMLLQFLQYV